MKKGFIYSKKLARLALTALATTAGSWGLWHETEARLKARRARAIRTESELASQINSRAAYDASHLSARRREITGFPQEPGAEITWAALAKQLGRAWAFEPATGEDSNEHATRSAAFRMLSPTLSDWPVIIEAVQNCEATAGVRILDVEMKSSGNRQSRALDLVRILVTVGTPRDGANPQP